MSISPTPNDLTPAAPPLPETVDPILPTPDAPAPAPSAISEPARISTGTGDAGPAATPEPAVAVDAGPGATPVPIPAPPAAPVRPHVHAPHIPAGATAMDIAAAAGFPTAPTVRDAEAKRAALVRMKRIALAALVAAAVGFLAVHIWAPETFGWGLLEAFFEASMVGAFADWFAVTALFRHPLGLPIPHTAIIPERKQRLANALSNFVGQNFLTPQNVLPRLERINFAEIVGHWLETPGNVRSIRERIVAALDGLLDGLSDDRIREFSEREVIPKVRDIALAPKLSELIVGLSKDGQHEEILDEVLRGAASVAASNRAAIEEVVRGQVPRFDIGFLSSDFIVQRVTDAVMTRIDTTISSMVADHDNPLRLKIHAQVQDFLTRLDTDPAMQAKVNSLRDRVLESPALQSFAVERWQDFKDFLRADLHDPDSSVFGFLEARGTEFGRSMLEDDAFQDAVNDKVRDVATWAITEHGQRIPDLIRDTVERWDGEQVATQIELAVGKDLQYIRLNGTLVGGLVGALLYLLTTWLG